MPDGVGVAGRLFTKGSIGEQIFEWAILAAVVQALGTPGLEELRQIALALAQNTVLTPAELAEAVVKGHIGFEEAAKEATSSGLDRERFQRLVDSTGEPPGPGELAVALRRGIIPEAGAGAGSTSFQQGVREGRLNNKWTDVIKALSVEEPSPIEPLEALLKGQLPLDRAEELYRHFGGDPEHFTWRFDSRGSAPTPIEAADMANRGIIPWEGRGPDVTSFSQAFREGPWRNKWEDAFKRLAEYRPPVRSIVAMVRNGAISDETALRWFHDQGATPEVAAALLTDAHHQRTQAARELTVAEVVGLYRDKLIDRGQATQMLQLLRLSAGDAAFLLAKADFDALQVKVRAAVSKVHNLYVNHKITEVQASQTLDGLGVAGSGRDDLLTIWNLERSANVQVLTTAEVVEAAFRGVISVEDAQQRLENMGWPAEEAAIRIELRIAGRRVPRPRP